MKKLILLFFAAFCVFFSQAQTITDSGVLRSNINTYIVPNSAGGITAARLNSILNGHLNVMQRVKVDSVWIADDTLRVLKFGVIHKYFLPSGSSTYTAGYALLLSSNQFKVDTGLVTTKAWLYKVADSIGAKIDTKENALTFANGLIRTSNTIKVDTGRTNIAIATGGALNKIADSLAAQINAKFTLPSLTSGSVLFSDGSTIAQKNSNFFWDNTNNRLGLGTTSPSYQLHVNGPSTNPQFALQSTVSPFGVTTFSVNNLGNLTITTNNSVLSMGTSVVDAAMLTSGLRTYATSQQLGNFYSPLGQQNSGAFTDATLQFGGSSAIRARNIMNGQVSSSTIANGEATANLLLGSVQYQTANSSVVPLLTNLTVRKQTNHVLGSSASVTNTASLYVEGAGSGTVTGSNYAIWSAAGSNRFDGDLTVKTISNGTAGTDSLLVETDGVIKKISPTYYGTGGGGGSGTVTSVGTGLGLSGGAITTNGTILLDTASTVVLSRQRATATYQPIGSYLTANQSITVTATGDATGTSSSSGTAPSIALTVSKINGTSLAGLATGILKNTTSTGVPSIAVAADFPTLNQNTTGTAANVTATSNSTLTTLSALSLPGSQVSGNISGNAANVTGTVPGANGGTGVNNGSSTITIGGNITHSGAFTQQFTATANTSVTLPPSGTLATLAGTETLTNKTIGVTQLNGSANTIAVNNTNATANYTETPYYAVANQTYSGTITWTGTTAPSGTANHSYSWSRIGNTVFVRLNVTFTTAGSALTAVTMTMPTDLPTPFEPAALTANSSILYYGTGGMSVTGTNAVQNQPKVYLRKNSGGSGYEFVCEATSGNSRAAYVNLTYFTN